MLKNLKYISWWKWTGILLVFFSLILGLGTPLSPGIIRINPSSFISGDTLNFQIESVNAHFKSHPDGIQCVLGYESEFLIHSQKIIPKAENKLEVEFIIPENFTPINGEVKLLNIELASDYDGLIVFRQGLSLKPKTIISKSHLGTFIARDISIQNVSSGSSIKSLSRAGAVLTNSVETLKIHGLTPKWFSFPYREILYESIRNLFFHVAMWPVMLVLFLVSVVFSILYLRTGKSKFDYLAVESVQVGLLFATIGIITGSLWAKYTWGDWWPNDPKLNGTAIAILLYFAYIILRNSLPEEQQRAKISAVYNVFAFPLMFVVIMILPRITDSLHPGNGGNPGFNTYDLDSHLRLALYPAFLGWILIGFWITEIRYRIRLVEEVMEE
jgi:heme exporter protein C